MSILEPSARVDELFGAPNFSTTSRSVVLPGLNCAAWSLVILVPELTHAATVHKTAINISILFRMTLSLLFVMR
jgi:hypothetical protein